MSAKTSSTLTVVLVVLIVVAGVVGYFAGSSAVPPPKTVTITTTVGGPAVSPTTVTVTQTIPTTITVTATPAAEKVYRWRVPVSRLPGDPLYPFFKLWAELVKNMSNGRLIIEIYAPGELFPVGQTLDAVARGTVPAAVQYLYWVAQDPVQGFSYGAPGPLRTPYEVWLYQKVIEDIIAKHVEAVGVKYIGPVMFTAAEPFQCRFPTRSLDDLKGKVVRSGGISAAFFELLGAKTVTLPVGEIYTALQQGAVDCIEWSDYLSNYKLGYHEVAKYFIDIPSNGTLHAEAFTDYLLVNPKAWEELPDDLKAVIKASIDWIFFNAGYQIYKFNEIGKELVLKAGATIITLPPGDVEKTIDIAVKVRVDLAKKHPDAAELARRTAKFWREMGYTYWADKLEAALKAEGLWK